jgi:hypothetical protein
MKTRNPKASFSIRNYYALAETIQSGEEEINAKAQRRKDAKRPSRNPSSADFQVCCVAVFQTRRLPDCGRSADLEVGDTAGLETCATKVGSRCLEKPSRRAMVLTNGTAKRMKPDQSCSLNSNRSQPASRPFFLCVFAPLRLCVETSLNTYGLGQRAFSDLPLPLIADS